MNKFFSIFLIIANCLLFGIDESIQTERNISPTIEIRYDDFLNDMSPSSTIGLIFDIDENRYTGFDVNTGDNETRLLLGWGWTVLGVGTKELDDTSMISIFSFGVKYEVLESMHSTVEYVMIDDPAFKDYLRLSIGVKF